MEIRLNLIYVTKVHHVLTSEVKTKACTTDLKIKHDITVKNCAYTDVVGQPHVWQTGVKR